MTLWTGTVFDTFLAIGLAALVAAPIVAIQHAWESWTYRQFRAGKRGLRYTRWDGRTEVNTDLLMEQPGVRAEMAAVGEMLKGVRG